MQGWKSNNDPWKPLPHDQVLEQEESQVLSSSTESSSGEPKEFNIFLDEPKGHIAPFPQNPLYVMVDSQQYIQMLERKLDKLNKKKENPSSKDIINSLSLFQDDQIRNYVNSDISAVLDLDGTDSLQTSSFLKRKLFPELQAISASELAELVKEDFVSKTFEEMAVKNKLLPGCSSQQEEKYVQDDNRSENVIHGCNDEITVELCGEHVT